MLILLIATVRELKPLFLDFISFKKGMKVKCLNLAVQALCLLKQHCSFDHGVAGG